MLRFYLATTLPAFLIALGAVLGGWWVALGLIFMTSLTFALDSLVNITPSENAETEFPAGDGLLVILGTLHFALMLLVVWTLANGSHSLAAAKLCEPFAKVQTTSNISAKCSVPSITNKPSPAGNSVSAFSLGVMLTKLSNANVRLVMKIKPKATHQPPKTAPRAIRKAGRVVAR